MKKPTSPEGTKIVLDDRKRRVESRRVEMRELSRHKKRIKARLKETNWPTDARTGEKADVDHEDVMAPLPEDLRKPIGDIDERMHALRADADQSESFVIPVDEGVLSRRRREADEERLAREKVRGEAWTEELVEARIEEAFSTLLRSSSGPIGPRQFGNAMPTPVRQMSDLIAQAGNKSLRRAVERMRRDRGPPSTEEVKRMEEALGWSLAYLRDEHRDLATFLNMGGLWKALGTPIAKKCREIGVHRQEFYRDRKSGVRKIVAGLTKDGKAPT